MNERFLVIDAAADDGCSEECGRCDLFPAPFRRVGEATYCRFAEVACADGEGVRLPAGETVRLLFVTAGAFALRGAGVRARVVKAGRCACLAVDGAYELAAQGAARGIVLSFVQRIEFGDRDLYGAAVAEVHPAPVCDAVPVLEIRSGIGTLLEGLFPAPELAACDRYHKMKAAELFMLIKLLYTSSEHAYFFQPLVRPRDDFRSFVSNNYERAGSVAELAALAGMSLSAFKRRFAEHFEESVYRWMMHRKALRIAADIRDGERSTHALMAKYGFRHYTQFSRFCKNFLHATPAQLIDAAGRP